MNYVIPVPVMAKALQAYNNYIVLINVGTKHRARASKTLALTVTAAAKFIKKLYRPLLILKNRQ